MADFTIRRAEPADFCLLPPIEDEADALYAALPEFAAMGDLPNLSPDGYHALPQSTKIWLAEIDRPVGFIYTYNMDDLAYIGQLSVVPAAARRGIGRALIEMAGAAAKAENNKGLVLTTYRDVPWNAPFYRKLGFVELQPATMGPKLLAHAAADAAQWSKFSPRIVMACFF